MNHGASKGWFARGLQRTRAYLCGGVSTPVDPIVRAQARMGEGRYDQAFAGLNELKAQGQTRRQIDYLRARCFLQAKQPHAAVEALKEELRYFPDNTAAASLLRELLAEHSAPPTHGDPEFREIYERVRPFTMLSEARLLSLFALAKHVCTTDLPGEVVECGVAAGGSAALLATVVARYSRRPRRVYAFDTFAGMPAPSALDRHNGQPAAATGWGTGTCAAREEVLLDLCAQIGVRHLVEPVKGLFGATLPAYRSKLGSVALLHMDGDWYVSTRDILENLFDLVVPGGRIQIDDFGHWEGCRRAVTEFQERRGLHFQMQPIDSTGVWLAKEPADAAGSTSPRLLNLGCGACFHPDWVNVDLRPSAAGVIQADVCSPLPFPDNAFSAVYHSHVLEHLPQSLASSFVRECYRVLVPGGLLRVAVPDLEAIARLYLQYLEEALAGDPVAGQRYDWMKLELLDQMVRERSGGEMLKYWQQNPMPQEEFVIQRMGDQVRRFLAAFREGTLPVPDSGAAEPSALAVGQFRRSGEVHHWMYDRYSLGRLLQAAGFTEVEACAAGASRIPGFNTYGLDLCADGSVRKPDSLFMEGRKPQS